MQRCIMGLGLQQAGLSSHNWQTEPMSGKTNALESSLQRAIARVSSREPHGGFKQPKLSRTKGKAPNYHRDASSLGKSQNRALWASVLASDLASLFNCPAKSSSWHFSMRQNSRFIVTTQTGERAVSQQGWERDYWGSSAFQVFFFSPSLSTRCRQLRWS